MARSAVPSSLILLYIAAGAATAIRAQPAKQAIAHRGASGYARHPDLVQRAHAAGLTVTSWTFRDDEKTAFPAVRDEMSHFLYTLGIDALFTNNPDRFPRRQ